MLNFCELFSHVHCTDEGIVCISDLLRLESLIGNEDSLRKQPKVALQIHNFEPPTYSFMAEETQGNYCKQFFGCSSL